MATDSTLETRLGWLGAMVAAAALLQAGCAVGRAEATFDRTLKVDGPVRLEVATGSGHIRVHNGPAGVVQIHGEVRAGGFLLSTGSRRAAEIASNPPIDQSANLIRVGATRGGMGFGNVSISYTVETPADTEVRAKDGSGDVEVAGVREPVTVTIGSGDARVSDLGDNATIQVGSGSIQGSQIQGSVNFTSGSGSVTFRDVKSELRGQAGSGDVQVDLPQGRVNVHTGSGPIRVSGAGQDVRASTGSGSIEVRGDPAAGSFWDLETGSGGISLSVPGTASFELTAQTHSGSVRVDMPITIEEQSRRFLRARAGDGRAHLNVETKSGDIRVVRTGAS